MGWPSRVRSVYSQSPAAGNVGHFTGAMVLGTPMLSAVFPPWLMAAAPRLNSAPVFSFDPPADPWLLALPRRILPVPRMSKPSPPFVFALIVLEDVAMAEHGKSILGVPLRRVAAQAILVPGDQEAVQGVPTHPVIADGVAGTGHQDPCPPFVCTVAVRNVLAVAVGPSCTPSPRFCFLTVPPRRSLPEPSTRIPTALWRTAL